MRLHTSPVSITNWSSKLTIFRFADLIENHKKANGSQRKPNGPSKHNRANKFKWTSNRYVCVYDPTDDICIHLYCCISSSQKHKLTHFSTAHATQTLQSVNTSSTPQSRSTPANPNIHRYSNLHGNSHRSYGNPPRRPDNQHSTKRKWSNMVYLPPSRSNIGSKAIEPSTVSHTSLKPSVSLRHVSVGTNWEEKCKGRGHFTTAESGLTSTSPRTGTIPPHLTWKSATASSQASHTKKSRSPVSKSQHQRHQTVVSDEATPSFKSSHPTVDRRQLGTPSTKYKWRRRSTSHSEFISLCMSHPLYITGCFFNLSSLFSTTYMYMYIKALQRSLTQSSLQFLRHPHQEQNPTLLLG